MVVRRGLMLVIVMMVVIVMMTVVVIVVVNLFNRSGRGGGLVQLAIDQHIDLGRLNAAPVYP
jgi:hypothetical protein